MPPDPLRRLAAVAARLPFAVDDYGAANGAFARWRADGRDGDRAIVDLWVYCYVQRYFYGRFLQERVETPSDVDRLISDAVLKTLGHLDGIRSADRFASYVSVVCKHALLSYREGRRVVVELPDVLEAEPDRLPGEGADAALVRFEIARAIESLPDAVRAVAQMRFLDGMSYEEMGEQTGQPLPTLRTYASKAMVRLRKDPVLRSLRFDDLLPPGALGDGASPRAASDPP